MNDLISRTELLKRIETVCKETCPYSEKQRDTMCAACDVGTCKYIVEELPSKQGEWIENEEQHHVEICYHCSECGFGAWGEHEKTLYCGKCGAEMKNCSKYYKEEE